MSLGKRSLGLTRTDVLVLLACFAVFFWNAIRHDFLADDAFISFRYARNLAEGHGLVFNPGERVEGYTNLFYVLVVAGFSFLGLDPVSVGRGIGVLSSLSLITLVYLFCLRKFRNRNRFFAAAAGGFLALNPYVGIWSLSGMETVLFSALLLGAIFPLAAGRPGLRAFFLSSLLSVVATLTRPEGAAVYVFLTGWFFAAERESPKEGFRKGLPGILVYLGLVGAAVVWRRHYYGEWLPNTFYVKSAFTIHHVGRGLRYLGSYAGNLHVLPAVLWIVLGFLWKGRRGISLVLGTLMTLMAVVVLEGGDGLPAYRFVVPCLALFFVLAAWSGRNLHVFFGRRGYPRHVPRIAVVALLLLSAAARRDWQYELYRYQRDREVPVWSEVGRWLAESMPPETTVAAVPVGAVGYHSRLRIYDMLGLTDKHIAHREVGTLGKGWAGHEKTDGSYILSRKPDVILIGNIFVSGTLLKPGDSFPPYSVSAISARERDLFTTGAWKADYRFSAVQMSKGRYLYCLLKNGFRPSPKGRT